MDALVLCRREGPIGHITLNRPSAFNALTPDMIVTLAAQLAAWRDDKDIHLVLLDSVTAPRVFCAGGDIRMLWESAKAGGLGAGEFFATEYRLNAAIARFPKPYVSLLDGLTMGGGMGISIHGSHRIVTENSALSMPETMIGFLPDIGSSYFLNRCPGEIGMYLGLTGARLKAADALYAGLATHYVASADIGALRAALLGGEALDAALGKWASNPGPSPIAAQQASLDRAFGQASVEAILAALDSESAWGAETQAALKACSPSALKLVFRQLRQSKGYDLQEALRMEYRLSLRRLLAPDFIEGVRALLIDKDRKPAWNPANVTQVPDAEIDACFASLGTEELTLQ